MLDAAPFTHIPEVPGADVSATPLAWLLAITAVLVAAGLAGSRGCGDSGAYVTPQPPSGRSGAVSDG
jgi:hypothetical protein